MLERPWRGDCWVVRVEPGAGRADFDVPVEWLASVGRRAAVQWILAERSESP